MEFQLIKTGDLEVIKSLELHSFYTFNEEYGTTPLEFALASLAPTTSERWQFHDSPAANIGEIVKYLLRENPLVILDVIQDVRVFREQDPEVFVDLLVWAQKELQMMKIDVDTLYYEPQSEEKQRLIFIGLAVSRGLYKNEPLSEIKDNMLEVIEEGTKWEKRQAEEIMKLL